MRTTPTATLSRLLQQFDESMIAAAVKDFELTDSEVQSLPPKTRKIVDTLQAPLVHGGFRRGPAADLPGAGRRSRATAALPMPDAATGVPRRQSSSFM